MSFDEWRLETLDGLELVRCRALLGPPGLAHAFSTRRGDGDLEFDLGGHDEATATVRSRRRRLRAAAGIGGRPVILEQVHGSTIVRAAAAGDAPPRADGVLALRGDRPFLAPAVRTADCVPVLLADSEARAVAAVHAGWRGTAAGVVRRAVEVLAGLGIAPSMLRAAIGPAIGACCYEVGSDVLQAVARETGTGPEWIVRSGSRLDLPAANRLQLERSGLPRDAIHVAPWCTACRKDLFFSYRRDGAPTGRMMACIGWTLKGAP